MRNFRASVITALAALMALFMVAGAACAQGLAGPARFHAEDVSRAGFGRTLELKDAAGTQRSLKEFRGRVVLVYFGFTFCADICPTELSRLAAVKRQLGDDGKRVQGIFVTLDPERDSAAAIGEYAAAFDPDFIGLRGNDKETLAVTREFRVFRQRIAGSAPDRYTIDHSSFIYVFDPSGRLRLRAGPENTLDQLADDVRALLAGR